MKRTLESLHYLRPLTGIQGVSAMYGDSTSVVVIPLYAALVASRIMKTKGIHLKTGDPSPIYMFVVGIGRQLPQTLFLILRNYEK